MIKRIAGKHELLVIVFTIFVDLLGFGILIPFIPLLLVDPRSAYFLLPTGMTQANLLVLISRSVDGAIQGEILGMNASVQAFGS